MVKIIIYDLEEMLYVLMVKINPIFEIVFHKDEIINIKLIFYTFDI